jgi:parallel beta-helix repeat protein
MSRTWFRGVRRGHSSSRQSPKAPGLIPGRFRPVIEVLEARDLPSTFLVTTADDSGAGSLRAAVLSANNHPEGNTIDFDIATGVQRIHLQSPLPAITFPVIVDGSTQPGFSGIPLVVLDGTFAGSSADGLTISGGDSTVRDLVIHGFSGSGLVLSGQGGNAVTGNYIGTTADGTQAFANAERGIDVIDSSHNTIGGTSTGSGNVISANGWAGILLSGGSSNVIQGNKIGTDVSGAQPLGNGAAGIHIVGGTTNEIGGATVSARNVISANQLNGVSLDVGSTGNVLQGNYIGTDGSGSAALGNGQRGVGVKGTSDNTIGGTGAGAGNVISGNDWSGVALFDGTTGIVVQNNFIGTDATGTQALPNAGNGIRIKGADNNTIGGTALDAGNVISGNQGSGVRIDDGSSGNQVQGNFIGTDASGAAVLGNGERGILINGSSDNEIGGTHAGAGNVVSGNTWAGVLIEQDASGNQVQGNLIGTDKTGTNALANGASGVRIFNSSGNLVGGTVDGASNVISGNDQDGVWIDAGASVNLVQGNLIGTDISGKNALGNGFNGVAIGDAPNNTIGGTLAGAANTIANNLQNGVLVEGPSAVNNTITANSIFANSLGGILLSNGGNGTAASPSLGASIVFSSTAIVEGALVAADSTTYVIDFYANTGTDASGQDEGQIFLGFGQVSTDANGVGLFNVTLALGSSAGQSITATATDPIGSTSAFSTAAPTTEV